jgi:hypothetical protein
VADIPASRNNYSSHVYESGAVLGEFEADGPDGPTHYSHAVFAGKAGCTIGGSWAIDEEGRKGTGSAGALHGRSRTALPEIPRSSRDEDTPREPSTELDLHGKYVRDPHRTEITIGARGKVALVLVIVMAVIIALLIERTPPPDSNRPGNHPADRSTY